MNNMTTRDNGYTVTIRRMRDDGLVHVEVLDAVDVDNVLARARAPRRPSTRETAKRSHAAEAAAAKKIADRKANAAARRGAVRAS